MASELVIRRPLFFLFLAVAPAFVFLGQAVILEPPAAILGSALYMVWLIVVAGESESPIFIGFFVVHFVIFATVYWLIAFALAKALTAVSHLTIRLAGLVFIVVAAAYVTQQPWYGSGGHGASRLGSLQDFLLGDATSMPILPISYLASVAVIAAGLLGWAYVRRSSPETEP